MMNNTGADEMSRILFVFSFLVISQKHCHTSFWSFNSEHGPYTRWFTDGWTE